MTSTQLHEGITGRGRGRDRYVICNALAYAIIIIERQPIGHRETSDMEDMKIILERLASGFMGADYFMEEARTHIDQVRPKWNGQ